MRLALYVPSCRDVFEVDHLKPGHETIAKRPLGESADEHF